MTKMAWLSFFFLASSLLLEPTLAAVCPESCVCSTTKDGLHRVSCSNLADLYKYTLRQKHHNINILDLSHNNISKITHELDRLTEVVTLDLSTNGLTELNKFLHNAKKLVHLNLAHNRIQRLSLSHLPTSVSSLDLTNNLLTDVPTDLGHLPSLEHLMLEGNPLDCSCENIIARNRLLSTNTYIDHVKCATPINLIDRSWLELKTKDVCKVLKPDYLDMMMGDQPIDAIKVGEETTALKSNQPSVAGSGLDEGKVIYGAELIEDDDSLQFMKVGRFTSPSPLDEVEGSGEAESTTISSIMEPLAEHKLHENLMANEEVIPVDIAYSTEHPIEGSGEGSGFFLFEDYEDATEKMIETTTPVIEELSPDPVHRIFNEDINSSVSEFPMPEPPSVYAGGPDWHIKTEPELVTRKSVPLEVTRDTTVSEQIRVTQASEVLGPAPSGEENEVTHKTGTYVCIALIIVLLVGLIGFAITKGQMRKRRDRRLLRQQKRDVEKASKEMVDMNKSLLGKPAPIENPVDKKVNGKYELVPTHESYQKKSDNGDVANGIKQDENQDIRTDSPRDTNQNKSSSIDNNLANQNETPLHETSFDSNNSRKDTNSLSSEDIFVPINDDDNPRINGNLDLNESQPHINGDPAVDSVYLSPSREYVPVYSPDMGRVRIKMTEIPKPKTPVLVTRSRSNAGDIIITPSLSGNATKSTT